MTVRQVLFIQGGGTGAHDDWDSLLVGSLRRGLGDGFEVRYPRMPDEHDPQYAAWSATILSELSTSDDGAVVVGHSVGGTLLAATLGAHRPPRRLSAVVLLAAPYVGTGGWPGDDVVLPPDLGSRLPRGVPVHVFHGTRDDTAPMSHANLYAATVLQAELHLLYGRDHQLGNDLTEVAGTIVDLGD